MNYYDVSIFYTDLEGDKCIRHFYGLPEPLISPVCNQFKNIDAICIDDANESKDYKPLPVKIEMK